MALTPMKKKPHYSGALSRRFWKRINSLPEPERREAYSLGVVLQNVEGDVLRLIEVREERVKARKGTTRRRA